MKYFIAAGSCIAFWILYCVAMAFIGLKGGVLVYIPLYIGLILIWKIIISVFTKKEKKENRS